MATELEGRGGGQGLGGRATKKELFCGSPKENIISIYQRELSELSCSIFNFASLHTFKAHSYVEEENFKTKQLNRILMKIVSLIGTQSYRIELAPRE